VKTPLSKDDFAKLMMDNICQTGEKGKIVYDSKEFHLRGEGKNFAMFLTNGYMEYCAAPLADRSRVIRHYVRNWFATAKEMPKDFEDVKPDLLPVVRSRAYFELNNLDVAEQKRPEWPHEVLGEHFGIGLVYDLPESMRSISQGSLDAWNVSFYEALEAAMENLLSLEAKFIGPDSGKGAYLSATGDNYDASRLLTKDAIRRFRVKGDHIAMIPNRENLIVVGSEDVKGLAGMAKLAAKAMKEPRSISGIALRLNGDDWVPWLPDVSHPSYRQFQELRLQSFGQDYAQQKEMLDKLYEKNGEDVFVANFSAIKRPDGKVFSYATWTETTNSLLPKTDVLVLGRLGSEPQMVEWGKVVEVMGDLMEAVDIYPPRFRVREFPTERQLAAMGNMLK
jgi:uncharacterized protein YtpQ (UPF0354 family)